MPSLWSGSIAFANIAVSVFPAFSAAAMSRVLVLRSVHRDQGHDQHEHPKDTDEDVDRQVIYATPRSFTLYLRGSVY